MSNKTKQSLGAIQRYISRVAPFLLPALFFQSAIFALISPLPLFILTLKNRLWISIFALATNIAFLYSASKSNLSEVTISAVYWFSVGVLFPFLLRKSGKIRLSLLFSFVYLVGVLMLSVSYFAHEAHLSFMDYVHSEISTGLDHLIALPDSPVKKMVDEEGRGALLKQFMTEVPSGILISILVGFWVNLLLASQLTQNFLSKSFWSKYKNPEWLIWPTLLCGALMAFTEHAPYYIGLNGFKFLLVLYGFQGLSVISHLLNHFKILGFPRALLLGFALFVTMPLVLSLGFFDLWFDFRRKFGHS